MLLDGRSLFRIVVQGYAIDKDIDVTPGDPRRVHNFLVANDFIGETKLETIERVIDWCRDHMAHSGTSDEELLDHTEQELHWQYRGSPPVERIIAGTTREGGGFAHWVRGCWSVIGFLRTTLRTVNIPVRNEERAHALPSFPTEDLYTSHGDDMLPPWAYPSSLYSSREILISKARFEEWFGPNVSDERIAVNVGRSEIELRLKYLPTNLLKRHCKDLDLGLDHQSSDVYEVFKNYYSLAELENENLWQRMDARISSLGGCDEVKRLRVSPVSFG